MRIFCVITTHTARHLQHCLAGVLWQADPFHGVVVSSDRDDPTILDTAREAVQRHASSAHPVKEPSVRLPGLAVTMRPHQGESRQGQVRNNGVRTLDARHRLRDDDAIVFLDGDIVLHPDAAAQHSSMLAESDAVLAFRAPLTREATDGIELRGLADFERAWPADAQAALSKRAGRYRRSAMLARLGGRHIGFVKPHKPKLISCHFSCRVGALRRVNGFDERYEGHGFEDDDLGKRLHALRQPRARVAIGVDRIRAMHLWHASRQADDLLCSPAYERFTRSDVPVRSELGLDAPRDQPESVTTILDAGPAGADFTNGRPC
ncbi:MAG: galactosyltransferase-related protein [Planctomycetota bacterium]